MFLNICTVQGNGHLSWHEGFPQTLSGPQVVLHPLSSEHPSPFSCDTPAHSRLHSLNALGRSGPIICFARHVLVNISSLLLVGLCWTPVFDSKSIVHDWYSDRFLYFVAKCRTTITVHILFPAFSSHPSAFLSLNCVNVILQKLWSRHGVGSEAICPVITVVRQAVTHADTELPFNWLWWQKW